MNGWTVNMLIWAQSSRLEGIRNRLGGRQARFGLDDVLTGLVILAVSALAMFLLARCAARLERKQALYHPRRLFRELCHAHDLDFGSERLLMAIARWQKLRHPARLFLESSRFESSRLSPELRARMPAIAEIRNRLFSNGPDGSRRAC